MARSQADAEEYVRKLEGSAMSFYAVVERKAVFKRAPVTTTVAVRKNIITD